MDIQDAGVVRPPIHLLATESDMVSRLALQAEHRYPVVASMLLEEIERAELHDRDTLPDNAVILGSEVDFVDERSAQMRKVKLVLPASANIAHGRISILTPMGATLERDPRIRAAINQFARRAVVGMSASYGSSMVRLVSDTIRTWDAGTVTVRLEAAVGRDLQYIRINGTLVGGLVGLVLHALDSL